MKLQPAAVTPAALFDHLCVRLLPRCTTPATLRRAHAHLVTTGLALHTYPLSRLLLALLSAASSFTPEYPLAVFRSSPRHTTFLYNLLISAFSSYPARLPLSWSLYAELATHPVLRPNAHTFPSLLRECDPHRGRALHAHVLKFVGDVQDQFVSTALVSFYGRCGEVESCRLLFDEIRHPDLAAWNAILSAYSCITDSFDDSGDCSEALLLFQKMQLSAVRPNELTLVAVIGACGALGALNQGMWLHAYALKFKEVVFNHFVATSLIDMYGKCGRLGLAIQVFSILPVKDTHCYNAMIRGLAVHGQGRRAVELLEQMRGNEVGADGVTFLGVMTACAHAGLVDEGRRCFTEMKDIVGIKPKVEHYGCLVDLLGRAGHVEEAEETVAKMPMRPNAAVHRALLAACLIHNKVEIGERVVGNLLQLQPDHGGNYVLLSNMYANLSRWEDVGRIRKMMRDRGISKDPGRSFLEMGGAVHEFTRGDRLHPNCRQIYAMLGEMRGRLREMGHRARTEDVLFDLVEEDKEEALSCHSERLAIAFALVASEPGAPIRITKNLRVCGDCHASTKLVSKLYEREIVVRDRSRFHRFLNGACSCLDYW